jgi:hypothetical protein
MATEPTHQIVHVPGVAAPSYADLLKTAVRSGYVTLEEAAEYARVSQSTIKRYGRLSEDDPCWLKIVGERGFRCTKYEWIDEWLERCARHHGAGK